MPPKKAPSESKQGLVITLVFFILMTLGLGVATYYGFAEQETLTKKAVKAEADRKQFQEDQRFYQAQANFYRAMMGYPLPPDFTAEELQQAKEKIDQGTMGKGLKSQEDVKKLVGDLSVDKDLGWDPAGKKAKMTYRELIAKLRNDYEALAKKNADLEAKVAAADKKAKEADDRLADAQKTFDAGLADARQKALKGLDDNRQGQDVLRNEITKLGQEKEELAKKVDDVQKPLNVALAAKAKEVDKLKKLLQQRDEQLEILSKARTPDAPAAMRTDWRIVRMDPRGTRPYINLGSKDRVQPQLTFSIHGIGLDGRPNPTPKGTLEVINVLEDHLSQARITSVNDPNRDPIIQGDVLYNPLWNPTLKKHVAVAGLVDLSGGARDPESGMQDFLRSLERQNVVVDAWMDPRDHYKIKGPGMNVATDYLILAESVDFFKEGRPRGANVEKEVEKGIQDMKGQATENHVPVIGLRRYLEMIGYRLPPQMQEPTGISPLYKPRPDQLPSVPADKQPAAKPEVGPNK
jgi:hypothetical protein